MAQVLSFCKTGREISYIIIARNLTEEDAIHMANEMNKQIGYGSNMPTYYVVKSDDHNPIPYDDHGDYNLFSDIGA